MAIRKPSTEVIRLIFQTLLAVGCLMSSTAAFADDYVIRDGKLVRIHSIGGPVPSKPAIPDPKFPGDVQTTWGNGINAFEEASALAAHLLDVDRIDRARKEALALAKEAAARNPGKAVAVPIYSDRPPTVDVGIQGISSVKVAAREYNVGEPRVYDTKDAMMQAILGPAQNSIGPGKADSTTGRRYMSGVAIGENHGAATSKNMTSMDVQQQKMLEAKRAEEIANQRAREAELKKEAAAREAEAAKAKQDSAKATAAEAERKKQEEAQKAAQQEAEQAKKNREHLAGLEREVRAKCAKGTTADCTKANDHLMKQYKSFEDKNRTAFCAMPVDDGPLTGPCADGAPPCIYCRPANELLTQSMSERMLGNRIFRTGNILQSGQINDPEFARTLKELLGPSLGKTPMVVTEE